MLMGCADDVGGGGDDEDGFSFFFKLEWLACVMNAETDDLAREDISHANHRLTTVKIYVYLTVVQNRVRQVPFCR